MDNFKDPTILCLLKIIRKFNPFLNVILLEMCVFVIFMNTLRYSNNSQTMVIQIQSDRRSIQYPIFVAF